MTVEAPKMHKFGTRIVRPFLGCGACSQPQLPMFVRCLIGPDVWNGPWSPMSVWMFGLFTGGHLSDRSCCSWLTIHQGLGVVVHHDLRCVPGAAGFPGHAAHLGRSGDGLPVSVECLAFYISAVSRTIFLLGPRPPLRHPTANHTEQGLTALGAAVVFFVPTDPRYAALQQRLLDGSLGFAA